MKAYMHALCVSCAVNSHGFVGIFVCAIYQFSFIHNDQCCHNWPDTVTLSSPSYVNVIWSWGLMCAGTVFAYGQSGSGKTYTMSGSKRTPGIISQAMNDIFDFIEKVSSASFPRLWMTSLTSLKRSVLHHFPGYEWHLWLHWKGQFCIISWMTSLTSLKRSVLHHFPGYEWHLWLHWKGQFCIISQAMNDIFDFIEKVSSASFPRLWMTSLTSLKRSVLHHFPGYEWHLWLHWKGQFCIISQAMNDIFDFIEKVSSGSFLRLWMTSLTSLKRSVLDHFSGYEWYLWLHWKGQFFIISQAMIVWMTSLTSFKKSVPHHLPSSKVCMTSLTSLIRLKR